MAPTEKKKDVFGMNAFVRPSLKINNKIQNIRNNTDKRKGFCYRIAASSDKSDSSSWEGWKLSYLFRQFLKKTGHFPLHERHMYVFPQPDSVLKLPPAKITPEQEFQKLSDEVRFKQNLELTQQSSPLHKQLQLVCIPNANATLFGQLIQYSQDRRKVWLRPLLLIEDEIDMFHFEELGATHKSFYNLVSSQDLLLPAQLVVPYNNGLTGLLNILHETVAEKVDSDSQTEIASQVLFRFLQSFHQ
ncbi:hypothetical protein GpartN1_g5090.t1 [Galdieria partita]|uniref:Uncharacterized protein n=1 Tax=Galdieria partita TaxID=83374 RepID=A0A9C7URS0_9RHOD|nr:hypothetical protein GpartN1_g5090.t1 [Galdieria partita]